MRTIITGATGGIGRAIAYRLAQEPDAELILVARDRPRAERLVAELGATGTKASVVLAEIIDPAMGTAVVEQATADGRGIDAIVIASGSIADAGELSGLSPAAYQAAFDINTRPLLLLAQAAYAPLRASGGAIVAVSSTGGIHPVPGLGGYSASKAALVMLARQLALEWGPAGIRVNCVSPGPTATAMAPAYADPAIRARRAATLPLRRISEPEDIADSVAFLLGPGARGITGIDLVVDGGMGVTTMHLSGAALGRGAE